MIDLAELRTKWLSEKPLYREYADTVKEILRTETQKCRLYARFESREKDLAEFLKKALRKQYKNPYDEITDKAGVRIIVNFHEDREAIQQIVERIFCGKCDDKSRELSYDKIGYHGIHYDVQFRQEYEEQFPKFKGLKCEIQLHTLCQYLWCELDHNLLYKSSYDIPVDIKRAVNCLSALLEVADSEFSAARKSILQTHQFKEIQMLDLLEKYYYGFTADLFDRELSLEVISYICSTYNLDLEDYRVKIDAFVNKNLSKLNLIFHDYSGALDRSIFLFQPEGLLILERLDNDQYQFKDIWAAKYPLSELEQLAIIWGKPLS